MRSTASFAPPCSGPYRAAAALYGPLHGGANEAVLRMLSEIGSVSKVPEFIKKVKSGEAGNRLMGFGHRVYKSYDPRAKVVKRIADIVFTVTGKNPLLEIALELERIALQDEYFVTRKLYPNVDFYSGLIYQAMGYSTDYFISRKLYPNVDFYTGLLYRAMGFPAKMFTVLFAIGRLPGWIAQWYEMSNDPETRIGRPRQLYTGPTQRQFVPIEKR